CRPIRERSWARSTCGRRCDLRRWWPTARSTCCRIRASSLRSAEARKLPRVAIVGRPNVGKSTLFNRLVGRRHALVDDTPGVTRDVRESAAQLGDLAFTLLDTAGWETIGGEALEARMRRFTERAIDGADVVLFLIDARAGVLPLDESFANWLRKRAEKVI